MQFFTRTQARVNPCTARTVYPLIKKDEGVMESENMDVGFARFDKNLGEMEPHVHSEECMYVIDCVHAYARFGESKEKLGERVAIVPGMIMRAAAGEWHAFEFENGGFMDIVWFFPGQSGWDFR